MRRRWASTNLFWLSRVSRRCAQLVLDVADRAVHALGTRHVVAGREHVHLVFLADHVPGDRVQRVDRFDLVAEELDAHRVLLVHRDDLDRCRRARGSCRGEKSMSLRSYCMETNLRSRSSRFELHAHLQGDHARDVLLGGAEAVDAGHRGDDDDVAAGEQRVGRRVAQAFDLVVDRGVLLDEGVGLRHVGLGLVVVVVGDEVLDGVVGQQLAELVGQLRGQRLVVRHAPASGAAPVR